MLLDAYRKNDASHTTPVPIIVPLDFPEPEYDFRGNPLNDGRYTLTNMVNHYRTGIVNRVD